MQLPHSCRNPLKLLGRRDFFFLSDEAGFVQGKGDGSGCGEEKQILEVFFLPAPILALISACLYELKYRMADSWSDTWYYIENMMRIPVWVLHSSPWAGLLIQNPFSVIQCAHLATINTACVSCGAPPTQGGKSSWDLCVQERKHCGQYWVTGQLKPCCGSPQWEYLRLAWGLLFSPGRLDFMQYFPCLEAEEPLLNQLSLKMWQDLQFQNRVMPVKLQRLPWLLEESEL